MANHMAKGMVNDTHYGFLGTEVNTMASRATKRSKVTAKPSRKRYEEKHPTVSFRLDKETYSRLKGHLAASGCSFATFIKDSLGREESMVEKRVEDLASKRLNPSVEQRLRFLEGLLSQVMITTYDEECPWECPRCGQELVGAMVAAKGETEADIFVYACPDCRFLLTPWREAPDGVDEASLFFIAGG